MKNKINKTENKQKHVKQSKAKKLDWLKIKAKQTSYAKAKKRKEKEKIYKITWSPFPSTPWKNLSFEYTFKPTVRRKNWNRSSLKGTWWLWEDLQGEQERIETDSGFQMLSCRCFVEWLTTYSNLVEYDRQLHNDDKDDASFV